MAEEQKQNSGQEPPRGRTATAPPAVEEWRGEVVVEVGCSIKERVDADGIPLLDDSGKRVRDLMGRNGYVMFGPTQGRLRGRWTQQNLLGNEKGSESIERLPDFPGVRIEIDGRRRRAVVWDPLNKDSHKRLLEIAAASMAEAMGMVPTSAGRPKFRVEPDSVRDKMSNDDVKTWLWNVRKLVDSELAVVISGTLPEMEEIEKLAGLTQVQQFNQGGRKIFKEKPEPLGQLVIA